MNATKNILDFLPHRPPFVMIDEISIDTNGNGQSSFSIVADNVLVQDNFFTESGLIENMAQTAGAAMGLKQQADKSPSLGFIGALKNLKIYTLPRVGAVLHTEVNFAHQVLNVLLVNGTVKSENNILATCELKIFIQQ